MLTLTKEEMTKVTGGYVFSCEEKKRGLMNLKVCDDFGNKIKTHKGLTAAEAADTMARYAADSTVV